jgi:hypothetical protein
MAELSDADKRGILGPDYRAPEVTPDSLAADAAARRATWRNTAIVVAVLAALVAAAVLFGPTR